MSTQFVWYWQETGCYTLGNYGSYTIVNMSHKSIDIYHWSVYIVSWMVQKWILWTETLSCFRATLADVLEHVYNLTSGIAEKLLLKRYENFSTTFNVVSKCVLRQLPKNCKFPNERTVCLEKSQSYLSIMCLQRVAALQISHVAFL